MTGKEISDDELEDELDKALAANDGKKDHCGVPMQTSRETGIQRSDVKLKKE